MGKVEKFEDLIAWQKARELTRAIYEVIRRGPFAKNYGLIGQMQRAAVSFILNIEKEFERGKPREFHQFLSIAKASCAEVRSQLYMASDVGYLDYQHFSELMTTAVEAGRIIGDLRVSVAKARDAK